MQPESTYNSLLTQALEQRRATLETKTVPQLKQECQIFHSSYRTMLRVLEQKGLIQPDPYKQDERISDIRLPSEDAFLESERDAQMSIRLSQYDNQLDFLASYFQFDLELMNLRRLKSLVALVKYIHWHQLTETSNHLMTRVLAEFIRRLMRDQVPLSSNIVKDSQEQLVRRSRSILSALKEIAGYQRECAKLVVRTEVLPHCNFSASHALADRDLTLEQLRRGWAQTQPETPFFADLAWEVIEEEFSPEGERLREELLDRVRVKRDQSNTQEKNTDEFRAILLDVVHNLVTVGGTLNLLLEKTVANSELLLNRKPSVMQRVRRWIDRLTNHAPYRLIMHIEMMDENTSSMSSDELDFERFAESVRRKSRLYGAILNRVSNPARRIQQANEKQLFEFVQKQVEELFDLQRRFAAIDTYIRSETAREKRGRIRDIRMELAALKEHLLRTNKKRHAYVTSRDEQEQLQKLGITPADT